MLILGSHQTLLVRYSPPTPPQFPCQSYISFVLQIAQHSDTEWWGYYIHLSLYNQQTVSLINVVLIYVQALEQGTLSQNATHPVFDVLLRLSTACTEGYCILGEQRC